MLKDSTGNQKTVPKVKPKYKAGLSPKIEGSITHAKIPTPKEQEGRKAEIQVEIKIKTSEPYTRRVPKRHTLPGDQRGRGSYRVVQEGIWRKRVRQRKASHARWQADAWTNTDWGLDRDDVGCRSWWYAQGSTRAGKYPGDAPHLRHERR